MSRSTLNAYLMELATVAAKRTTCIRRGVGCVLADSRGRVLSIGYNGVASGQPHCNEPQDRSSGSLNSLINLTVGANNGFPSACKGHHLPAGQDSCEAVHAEQNALLQCRNPQKIDTAYITLSPCKPCLKLLLNTSCKRIVVLEELTDTWSRDMWLKTGREWVVL